MKITLLHPSRKRSVKAFETMSNWLTKISGDNSIEYILSIDNDDPQMIDYIRLFRSHKIIISDNKNVVQATNAAAKAALDSDILVYLSDDFDCPDMWDELIVDAVKGHMDKEWLLKVNDCLQQFHVGVLTIPIMSTKLYRKLGYFWHPGYASMFVDEDLYWTTKNNNWLLFAPQLKFPHLHCSIGKATRDETYIRSEANWDQGKAFFAKRKQEGFPL